MYYKKHNEIPALPKHITEVCIEYGESMLNMNVPLAVKYGSYEIENKNSIAYIPEEEFNSSSYKKSGEVGFYFLAPEVSQSICDFYNQVNNPLIKNVIYFLQVVTGADFVAPHIDDPDRRSEGMLYLLKAGGANVRTQWYEPKEEFKDLELANYTCIPKDKLNLVEDQCLEEDCWHWMNFSKIHGVENQESVRFALWGFPTLNY